MRVEAFSFGSIRIDGVTYTHDVMIDRGTSASARRSHPRSSATPLGTPLSMEEDIPWKCLRLVIGTGTGRLPVMDEVKHEARCRQLELVILPTAEAIRELNKHPDEVNAILHVTC